MTRRRIVYQRPDGGVSVVVPSPRYVAQLMSSGMTEAEAIAAIRAKDAPAEVPDIDQATGQPRLDAAGNVVMKPFAVDAVECNRDDIPADRTFRDAWRRDGARPVRIDMPAAREIHRQRLEARSVERASRLREEYLQADEDGDAARSAQLKARIRGMRQRLAALDLNAAQTPEDLKVITDEEIGPVYPARGAAIRDHRVPGEDYGDIPAAAAAAARRAR